MGKAKKLRSMSHKKRAPPTGGPSTAELEELQAMDLSTMAADEAQLFKGLVDLQGAVREATCVAIATMFGDVESDEAETKSRRKLQRMVDAGLLKKLIPRVVDPLPMVRQHALGALRNMSVTGGLELCELMTTQNVVTPLVKVITDNATDAALNGSSDLRAVQLLEQAVALLGNLCESCQAAINELTQGELLPPIFKIAAQARTHTALHLETLKLLLLITEGNAQLNEIIGANSAYQQTIGALIQAPADQLSLQVRLEAVGIAMNLPAIMQLEDNVARMVPLLEAALAYDAVNVVQMAQQASENYELSQNMGKLDGELIMSIVEHHITRISSVVPDVKKAGRNMTFWYIYAGHSKGESGNVSSFAESYEFQVLPALFGGKIPTLPYRIVAAYPQETACNYKGLGILATRSVVVVKRGGCSFGTKLR
ncbi:hypothetical protein PInf_012361 [Phytophthora infestans]|nr:hypothetical protein PInf_012361 [Phytophthora infestans]